jgi:hypothetical protein
MRMSNRNGSSRFTTAEHRSRNAGSQANPLGSGTVPGTPFGPLGPAQPRAPPTPSPPFGPAGQHVHAAVHDASSAARACARTQCGSGGAVRILLHTVVRGHAGDANVTVGVPNVFTMNAAMRTAHATSAF